MSSEPVSLRAAIYCRLSQDRSGEGLAVARQEREGRRKAEALGWQVADVYSDNDVSASSRKPRPEYRRMLADVAAGRVEAIIVWKADRLYRHPIDLEDLVDIANRHKLRIATVTAGDLNLDSSEGRMLARMLGAAARAEVERTAERSIAGKVDAASRGGYSGGPAPYGFRLVPVAARDPAGAALELVEEQAVVVREACRRVLAGDSLRSIAADLNARGLRTAEGKHWSGSALRKVLVRPTTAGLRAHRGEIVGNAAWEPLVDREVWAGVVALLSDESRRTTQNYARRYLGSGLYRCGVCGGPLTGNTTAGGGPGGRRTAYRCRTADRDGSSHVVRDAERLDEYVEAILVRRLSLADASTTWTPQPEDLGRLHTEVAALNARLDEFARAQADDKITLSQLFASSERLRARIAELEREILLSAGSTVLDGLAGPHIAVVWDTLPLDRRRAVLDLLMTVSVLPRGRKGRLPGGGSFDPAAVRIDWKPQA